MIWFKLNEMIANPEKIQLIFFGRKEDQELSIEFNGNVIKISDTVKHLGVTIDSKLRFNEHVKTICQKTNSKVKAFSRFVRYLEPQKFVLTSTMHKIYVVKCSRITNLRFSNSSEVVKTLSHEGFRH